jgi:excisionase family DNA binding protein
MRDMASEADNLIDLRSAARVLGCSPMTARRMVKGGFLPSVKLPGTRLLRFRPAAIQRVIESSEHGKGAA